MRVSCASNVGRRVSGGLLVDARDSVSLLTHFEDCKDAFDWTLGIHGIWVHFDPPEAASSTMLRSSGNSKRASTRELSATFLPDVPPKAGWNQRQTLDAAIRKAGHQCVLLLELSECRRPVTDFTLFSTAGA